MDKGYHYLQSPTIRSMQLLPRPKVYLPGCGHSDVLQKQEFATKFLHLWTTWPVQNIPELPNLEVFSVESTGKNEEAHVETNSSVWRELHHPNIFPLEKKQGNGVILLILQNWGSYLTNSK